LIFKVEIKKAGIKNSFLFAKRKAFKILKAFLLP